MLSNFKPIHILTVNDRSGALYATVAVSDPSVMRLALVRAVEEWFDSAIAPEFQRAQLDMLPPLDVTVR